ncbi:MAG TPA: hypothetical protein VLW45_11065 [Pelomicrobium sp.]|nr:hypothetical protein [Pelomicrobium sp.]
MSPDEILAAFERLRDELPAHPDAHYALGVVLLDRARETGDTAALAHSRAALRRAAELGAGDARIHAMLGHALDWDEDTAAEATAALAEAHRLQPDNALFETYWITLLAEGSPQNEALPAIEAAAARQGIDLAAVRSELAAADFPADAPTLVMNAFLRARNHVRSHLMDEVERLLGQAEPERAARQRRAMAEDCRALQADLEATLKASEVPAEFRALMPLAARYGLGDDGCRGLILAQLTDDAKAALIRDVEPHAAAIDTWLDGYPGEAMPAEAAAFMYLLLALEELGA